MIQTSCLKRFNKESISIGYAVRYMKSKGINYNRFGVEYTDFKDDNLNSDSVFRFAPDYNCHKDGKEFFIEVKYGKAIEYNNYLAYKEWNNLRPVYIFLADIGSKYGDSCYIQELDKIQLMTRAESNKPEEFKDDYFRHSATSTGSEYASKKLYGVIRLKSMIKLLTHKNLNNVG